MVANPPIVAFGVFAANLRRIPDGLCYGDNRRRTAKTEVDLPLSYSTPDAMTETSMAVERFKIAVYVPVNAAQKVKEAGQSLLLFPACSACSARG
jgi:hypothetical protein